MKNSSVDTVKKVIILQRTQQTVGNHIINSSINFFDYSSDKIRIRTQQNDS